METAVLFAVIVAVVVVTSVVKLPWFSQKTKVAVATVASVIASGVYVWFTGDFDVADFGATALTVFGGSQLIYQFILNNTELDDKLEHVGVKTTYDAS